MKKLLPEAIIICALVMVISFGFAQTWTQSSANAFAVQSISLSANGQKVVTLGSNTPFVSTNGGFSWNSVSPVPKVDFAKSSADGTKLIGVARYSTNNIYTSTNSGNTWNPTASSIQYLSSCAISADATKLFVAVNGGFIYTSTNWGTNWISIGAVSNTWKCLAVSSTGSILVAGAQNDKIYISTNSGVPVALVNSPINSWTSIASSTDGSRLVATGGSGTYFSTNSGNTWRLYGIAGKAVASSSDGRRLIVCTDSILYVSTNGGFDLRGYAPSSSWVSVASSADGNEFLAGANYGIWIFRATRPAQLNLSPVGSNLNLSWLVPSTNFVLQRSLDLISWSSITNTPVLNFTNLYNEVMLAPAGDFMFYRLVTSP